MYKLLIILMASLTLFACEKATEQQTTQTPVNEAPDPTSDTRNTPSQQLTVWLDKKYEEELRFSPITLAFLGRKEQNDKIDDASVKAELEQAAWKAASVEQMKASFNYADLDASGKLAYDMWVYQSEETQASLAFTNHGYVFDQMSGTHTFFPTFLINFHQVDNPQDMQAYISRISGVANAMQQLLVRAKTSADMGIRPPKFAFEIVIDEINQLVSGRPFDDSTEDSAIWADAKSKIGSLLEAEEIDQAQATKLQAAAQVALLQNFETAYRDVLTWLETDIDNADVIATGVGKLPDGEAYYSYRLANSTTTNSTPEEIHQIGLDEVARIHTEMEQIKNQVGFEGSLQDFFKFVRDDEQFYFPNTDEGRQEYLTTATELLDEMKPKLPEFFGRLPKADLVVKRVEPFREQDGAAQHYFSGTPDGSRPGIYYVHLSDMSGLSLVDLETTAYHEGNPGHHMQSSIAQELEDVPEFLKQAFFGAYVEGWALYAEYLAKEMGAFSDPYSDFGRLNGELWRAIRLVLDSGLHAQGWTEQQAITYMTDNSAIPESAVLSEVRRYIVTPGQASSYKIGMLKIQELRALAQEQLGEKFDIREFHDIVLGSGALPLSALDKLVNEWIDSVR
jgi:uncharacterized protein (DUF885 family)